MTDLNRKSVFGCFAALVLTYSSAQVAPAGARAVTMCEHLKSMQLPRTTITASDRVEAGAFSSANARGYDYKTLPAFCRVQGVIAPSSDSHIEFEVWMPASGWNGKYQGIGNGGFAGEISYSQLASAMNAGYAASSTDTGHKGGGTDATWALGHPEKVVDYGYRAIHETAEKAKTLIATFYGEAAKHSYFTGCSNGGRQALMEAQRFPGDYDGIIAGAPVNYRTHQLVWEIWIAQAVHTDPASYIPAEKYPVIHRTVVEACDARDGLKDGLIDDPRMCRFDPDVLACTGDDGPACLSLSQIRAARKIYSPAINPRTNREIFPALQLGSELGWGALAGPQPADEALQFFKSVVFKDASWNYRALTFDTAAEVSDKAAAETLNVTNPDLGAFFRRGGKLLMYHGWNDQLVAPNNTINYYNSVVDKIGDARRAASSLRLFMVPGLNHCTGGEGPNTFDTVRALDQWVENGNAPDRIDASHVTDGVVDRTRPLCPYPRVARYKGNGSINDAANFECRLP